jgi:S-(hydroxymethyl)glutathione dehydrogenase/alcohol dehydrogenase
MKTNAMILTTVNEDLEYKTICLQDLSEYDVLVRVLYTGVCHTQLLEARGHRGEDKFLPHCMGHEASGIVEKIGKKVTTVSTGDKVALTWIKCNGGNSGGKIHTSVHGDRKVNAGPVATFSQHTIVSENKCIKVGKNIDDKLVAILGCALATGYGLVNRTAKIKKQETVAIVGAGGIGQSTLIFSYLLGVKNISVFDINDKALSRASNITECDLINVQDPSIEKLKDSFDCVLETSGSKAGSEMAYDLANRQNGRVVLAGNLKFGTKILIDPFHLLQGKKLIGCGQDNSMPEIDFSIIESLIEKNNTI